VKEHCKKVDTVLQQPSTEQKRPTAASIGNKCAIRDHTCNENLINSHIGKMSRQLKESQTRMAD